MKTRRNPTVPSTASLRLLPLCAFALALACSSGGGDDAGPPLSAQEYFNLNPNLCFEYTTGDAGTASRGLLVQATTSPVGVSIKSLHNGGVEQIDYLSFDGGVVLLTERQIFDTTILSWVFATPLTYLQAPLADGQDNLVSTSSYTFSGAPDAGNTTGSETYTVGVLGPVLWTGVGADAGGSNGFKMQFSASNGDGGGDLTQNRSMLPEVGFVQLLATDDNMAFVTFSLINIRVLDGGTGCGQ